MVEKSLNKKEKVQRNYLKKRKKMLKEIFIFSLSLSLSLFLSYIKFENNFDKLLTDNFLEREIFSLRKYRVIKSYQN